MPNGIWLFYHFIDYECIIHAKCISNAFSLSICICKLALTTIPCYDKMYGKISGSWQNEREAGESCLGKGQEWRMPRRQATGTTPRSLLGLIWFSELLCYRECIWLPNISSCSVCSQASESWESRIFGWVSGLALPALLPALYQEWVKHIFEPLGFHNGRWQ